MCNGELSPGEAPNWRYKWGLSVTIALDPRSEESDRARIRRVEGRSRGFDDGNGVLLGTAPHHTYNGPEWDCYMCKLLGYDEFGPQEDEPAREAIARSKNVREKKRKGSNS